MLFDHHGASERQVLPSSLPTALVVTRVRKLARSNLCSGADMLAVLLDNGSSHASKYPQERVQWGNQNMTLRAGISGAASEYYFRFGTRYRKASGRGNSGRKHLNADCECSWRTDSAEGRSGGWPDHHRGTHCVEADN